VGFTTRRPEEPCAASARTVLWEPGRPTAPASRSPRWRCAPAGAARPELADEVRALLPDEVVDELLAGAGTEEGIARPGGLLTKRLVERATEVELTDHLGYEPRREPPGGTGTRATGRPPSG
jgi:hypothetical protein